MTASDGCNAALTVGLKTMMARSGAALDEYLRFRHTDALQDAETVAPLRETMAEDQGAPVLPVAAVATTGTISTGAIKKVRPSVPKPSRTGTGEQSSS